MMAGEVGDAGEACRGGAMIGLFFALRSSGGGGDSGGMEDSAPLDPHGGQGVVTAGAGVEGPREPGGARRARGAVVLVHGRGASAKGMLELYFELVAGEPWAGELGAVAPQAADFTWYPQSFLAPMEANQPYLDSALRRMESVVGELIARGVPGERVALLGFSQGACVVCEFVARHPRRYGAVIGLTGGLIGPPGTPREYAGSLEGTPVFLGTSDPDPHVPFQHDHALSKREIRGR